MVEDDAITVQRVQVGRRIDGQIEIVGGLDEGQQVVADVSGLHRGVAVRVIDNGTNS
jgi:hypothetical protein